MTKKASHPNSLVYQVQLERGRKKYLVQEQLDDGQESAVALGAPQEEEREQDQNRDLAKLEAESECGLEAVLREGAEGKEGEDTEQDPAVEEDTGRSKNG